MHRTIPATIAILALAAGAAGCSGNSSNADAKPSASTPAAHTEADCLALLEANYTAGTPKDVSAEPECASLTQDQYTDLVGQVLNDNKDQVLDDAATETAWDTAWNEMDVDAQADICELLVGQGPEAADGLTREQAEYFLDTKC
ncbi:hypothetical protein [Streptomyces sp. NPDC050560]|uniref:hypothetical protein n=1 Tax=Streptomyces sp. NPDC050560 TaxID=3365630 RepID=UPI0037B38D7B